MLQANGVSKKFEDTQALNRVTCQIPSGPRRIRSMRVSKKTSPPRKQISSVRFVTTSLSTSVPTCGLDEDRISSLAPALTNVSRMKRILPSGSFTPVFSFPSENVPAPPSPNCIFEFSLSTPRFLKSSTVFVLSSILSPRSRIIGS